MLQPIFAGGFGQSPDFGLRNLFRFTEKSIAALDLVTETYLFEKGEKCANLGIHLGCSDFFAAVFLVGHDMAGMQLLKWNAKGLSPTL
jgi:hypothetical protein